MEHTQRHPVQPLLTLQLIVLAVLSGCASSPFPEYKAPPPVVTPPPPVVAPAPVVQAPPAPTYAKVSNATTPREYRRDAAGHLYEMQASRIYRGKLPPLLYAVGVLQVEVNQHGQVVSTSWMRAPTHAPEVMADIERTVRAAAPFPAPLKLGNVTYTDTWLWDKSGRFQLDTLTEGQM